MQLCFLVDPLAKLKPAKDSSVAMMRAAQARGHTLWAVEPTGMHAEGGDLTLAASRVRVSSDDAAWYEAESAQYMPAHAFDAIIERKDPPFDMEYVYRTYLLERAEAAGVKVFNRPGAIRAHNEKLAILQHADMIAPTLVARAPSLLRGFVAEHQDVIFKPLDGMGGTGIFRVRAGDPNLNVIIETLGHNGSQTIMAQRFLPAIKEGDKRILLIDGKVVPFALARIPAEGETRGNLAAGGRPEARPLSESDQRIAHTMAERLAPRGLFLVGLDVIGDKVTEINVTSPTGFVEIHRQTGFDVAQFCIEQLEAAC